MKRILFPLLMLLSTCVNAQVTILSESFNISGGRTTTPPTGWTVSGTGTNGNTCSSAIVWEQVGSGGFFCAGTPNPAAHSGSGMAGYNSWDIYNGGKSELVTPVLDFSGPGTTTLKVWIWDSVAYYSGSPNPQYDSLSIWVNTSPTSAGGTMLYLGTPSYHSGGLGWTQFVFNIPTTYTSNTNYFIFRGASLYGNDIFFDDVEVIRNPPTPCNGTPAAPSITTTAMSVSNPLCSGSTKSIAATDPNFPLMGGTTYQWEESPTGATGSWTPVITGTGGTTLNYTTGPLTSSTYFRMGIICTATSSTAYSGSYLVPVGAPQPSAIIGSATFCPGDTEIYSVTNVASTTYNWTIPTGWILVSGATTNSIKVVPDNTPGSISVTATTTCGTSVPQTRSIIPGNAPASPTAITGVTSACPNITTTYSIAAVTGATSYQWTVPSGWTINSTASNGLSINVTTGLTSGNISVDATNGCGTNSKSLAVNIITALANPGTITGPSAVCSGVLYNYSINPVPGATTYQWVLPAGWSGTISGTSIQAYAGTGSGTISVTANSACATSPTSTLSINVTPSVTPTATVTTTATTICESAPITFTANITNGGSSPWYIWKKNGTPIITSGNTYVDNKLATGDIITVSLVSNAVCRTSDTIVSPPFVLSVTPKSDPGININSTPVITACAGTMFNFTTTTTAGGNTPGYQWFINSLPVTGANNPYYSTGMLNNHDTVSVLLTTSAVCPTVPNVLSNKVVVTLINNVSPTVTVSASSTTATPGVPITFTATESGGGATPGFQWFLNSVAVPNETQSTYTSSTLQPGDRVWVRLQSYAPCANPDYLNSNEVVLQGTTGIPGIRNWEGTVSLYPNPTGGRFNISATTSASHSGKTVTIDVLNMVGQNVYHTSFLAEKAEWNREINLDGGLSDGQYMLRISSADGMSANVPFVLRH